MNRDFLEKFLDKLSEFPQWIKKIIYVKLSSEIDTTQNLDYVFMTFAPVLTDKGKCELDNKNLCLDNNIYNILDSCDKKLTISDIILNTFLSLEETAAYFLFCVDEGFIQIPDNSQVLNIAGFLAGKFKTGEYFLQNGEISQQQLDDAVLNYEHRAKPNKKFGQSLIELGLINEKQLETILKIKQEAQKRFILDHNEVPKIKEKKSEEYEKQIEILKKENERLKQQLRQLLLAEKHNV